MADTISYRNLNIFPKLVQSYLYGNEEVEMFYSHFPKWENLPRQMVLKSAQKINRTLLADRLIEQYKGVDSTEITLKQIDLLRADNTFTVTTGHQLNLFTGPLYFIYKIISTVKLCRQLQERYPAYHFVPVYWMATEDHDFEEIRYFHPDVNQTVTWEFQAKGAVGRLKTNALRETIEDFFKSLDDDDFTTELKTLFREAYENHHNLSFATRILVHKLLGKYGLVILDADDRELKKEFAPFVKTELTKQLVNKNVTETNAFLKQKNWDVQVNPREINLFYLKDQVRSRLVLENGCYKVLNTDLAFTEEAILQELEQHPDRFSPNVLFRPLYQEAVLPNLAYVGGGAEIAYWLQLKAAFESFNVVFPVLVLRNSALWIPEKIQKKWEKLGLSKEDYLADIEAIRKKMIVQNENATIPDFTMLKNHMTQDIEQVTKWVDTLDPTLVPSVRATLQKQLNEWDNWEQKFHKILKKKHTEHIDRATGIIHRLYPEGILQERYLNFSFIYRKKGSKMFDELIEAFDPFQFEFSIFQY